VKTIEVCGRQIQNTAIEEPCNRNGSHGTYFVCTGNDHKYSEKYDPYKEFICKIHKNQRNKNIL
jgi:hypothetical protein